MLFFPYPTIKRLSPVKRKIKFHDGTKNRDFQGENTPKPTLSKPENTKIGESGGKKAGSQIRKKADSTLKADTQPTNIKPPSIRQKKAAGTQKPHTFKAIYPEGYNYIFPSPSFRFPSGSGSLALESSQRVAEKRPFLPFFVGEAKI